MRRVLRDELFKYNDYELLYLSSLGGEEATSIIFEKYSFMIKKMIARFSVPAYLHDDYEQEGLLMINKAIKTYKDNSKMTFTRYVELLIYRRFIDLERIKNKRPENLVSIDDIDYIIEQPEKEMLLNETIDLSNLSELENKVYECKYLQGLNIKEICSKLEIKVSQVYSALERIKRKLKMKNK